MSSKRVAMGLEMLGDKRAAKPLSDLFGMKGIRGHAFLTLDDAVANTPPARPASSHFESSTRLVSLRELILARALYRCGDHKGLGEAILNEYAKDLRGLYVRHARQVLGLEN